MRIVYIHNECQSAVATNQPTKPDCWLQKGEKTEKRNGGMDEAGATGHQRARHKAQMHHQYKSFTSQQSQIPENERATNLPGGEGARKKQRKMTKQELERSKEPEIKLKWITRTTHSTSQQSWIPRGRASEQTGGWRRIENNRGKKA